MRKPKVYYLRLKKMLVQLKQMQTELHQMHDEVEERYDNLSENRKYSDFGYEMEETIDNLYNAYSDEIDSLIDYIDDAAFGFMTLPLADGYPSQRGYEEYEEMKQLDEAEKGTIAKFNNEAAPLTIANDDDNNSGNSKDYDEAIAALNSLAALPLRVISIILKAFALSTPFLISVSIISSRVPITSEIVQVLFLISSCALPIHTSVP